MEKGIEWCCSPQSLIASHSWVPLYAALIQFLRAQLCSYAVCQVPPPQKKKDNSDHSRKIRPLLSHSASKSKWSHVESLEFTCEGYGENLLLGSSDQSRTNGWLVWASWVSAILQKCVWARPLDLLEVQAENSAEPGSKRVVWLGPWRQS